MYNRVLTKEEDYLSLPNNPMVSKLWWKISNNYTTLLPNNLNTEILILNKKINTNKRWKICFNIIIINLVK